MLDNLCRSDAASLDRVLEVAAGQLKVEIQELRPRLRLRILDLCNQKALEASLKFEGFNAVIHLAGFKSVGESKKEPLLYYENNVVGFLNLIKVLKEHKVSNSILLSSSCTVYAPSSSKIAEDAVLQPTCPYGQTKCLVCTVAGRS